jgi:hypothetical protein
MRPLPFAGAPPLNAYFSEKKLLLFPFHCSPERDILTFSALLLCTVA